MIPAAEVVGKWKSQSDFQGGLGRRLFHNLILSPGPTPEAFFYMAGCQVITHGRIGVITEAETKGTLRVHHKESIPN